MSARRFGSLVHELPMSARVHREQFGGWSTTDYLLARQVEETHAVMRAVYASIPMKPHQRPKIEPLVIPRPGAAAKPKRSWLEVFTSVLRKR